MPLNPSINYESYKNMPDEERLKSISKIIHTKLDEAINDIMYELDDSGYLDAVISDLTNEDEADMETYEDLLTYSLEDIICMTSKYVDGSTQKAVITLRLKEGVEAADWEKEDLYFHEMFVEAIINIIKKIDYIQDIYWKLRSSFNLIHLYHNLAILVNDEDLIRKTSVWNHNVPIR